MHYTTSGISKVLTRCSNFRMIAAVYIIVIIITMQPHSSGAQTINKNLNIYIGYSSVSINGDSLFRSGSFVTPAFYPHLQSTGGFFMKGSWNVHDFVSVGADFSWHAFSDWKSSFSNLYNKMELNAFNFSPFIELRTPQTYQGLLNRICLFAGFGPVIGISDFKLAKTPWSVDYHHDYSNELTLKDKGRFLQYGYKYTLGGQWNLSRSAGVFASFSGFSNRVETFAFPDEKYRGSEVTLGVYLRFMSKKRFYR
ncbi:MAG: hypothetical protein EA361_04095 [Bacteroidetes bacterium]|nr:MAG: hypothetical protein EA361_04095 [Bacteroidota bacterium]